MSTSLYTDKQVLSLCHQHSLITEVFAVGLSAMSRMLPQESNIQISYEKELAGRPTYLNYKEERERDKERERNFSEKRKKKRMKQNLTRYNEALFQHT